MLKSALFALAILLFVSGCYASKMIVYDVSSDPTGAVIEADDVAVCTATPCEFDLICRRKIGAGSVSRQVVIKASPTSSMQGELFVQTKTINPCDILEKGKGQLIFNLHLDAVTPVNRSDVKSH